MTEICEEHRKFMMDVVERLARMETLIQTSMQSSKAEVLACQAKHGQRFDCIERDAVKFDLRIDDVCVTQRRIGWIIGGAGIAIIGDLVVHLAKGGW